MDRMEVLVAAMGQTDFSKFNDMNLQTDVVFANQGNQVGYREQVIAGKKVKMISNVERGVGKNRNTALLYATADICLLSDEDVVYVDGYERKVLDAFRCVPDADILIFNIETERKTKRKTNHHVKRVGIHNFLNYGAVRIAFRREKVIQKNIWFSLLFGGGARYGAGEDSLFLREAIRKGLIIKTYPVKIADVKEEGSTWFTGYNQKYFFDKGAFLAASFPILKYLFALYFTFKFRKSSSLGLLDISRQMVKGIKAFDLGISYRGGAND
jgi:glycosyltransferase involved in cell wall biosynthesis